MKLAKIHSKATYHRVIQELARYGYILYNPSYHPVRGSEVSLIEDFSSYLKKRREQPFSDLII